MEAATWCAISLCGAFHVEYCVHSGVLTKLRQTRQLVAVQREGGIPVGKKILHPYQGSNVMVQLD